ncbi:tetratricopeptide repeat protein [Streptomyces sp. NPDC048389]|uniref:tetratricopeptide repeat protein n=1 Tax=Streptomyces sp. NPDC048389 TaxID=3154622 RepID=UPI0034556008
MKQTKMVHSPPGFHVIGVQEAEERFQISADVAYPYAEFADDQDIRLYDGDLHIAGSLAPEPEQDWVLYNMVVDGDLTVDGDLDWFSRIEGTFLLVAGNLRVRHAILDGRPDVVVRGNLESNGVVHGSDEDHDDCCSDLADSGKLTVRGSTRARLVVVTSPFRMGFGARPQVLIAGAAERVNHPPDLDEGGLSGILLPGLLGEDGRPDPVKVQDALRTDRPVLRADADLTPPARDHDREGSGHPLLDSLLDRAQEVVRDTHPGAYLVMEDIAPRPAADDPSRQQVRDLVRAANEKLYGDTNDVQEAVTAYAEALALCVPGAHYCDHDQLCAYYGLVEALSRILGGTPDPDRPELTAELIRHAEQALFLLPDHITTTTDEGHLQAMVKLHTGNALAWYLLHSGEPERALTAVEQALSIADDPGYDWVRVTQVRVLLALGRTDEAYRVTDEVLSRVPSYLLTAGVVLRDAVFGDLTDIVASSGFQQWREARRGEQQQGSTPA